MVYRRRMVLAAAVALTLTGCSDGSASGYLALNGHVEIPLTWGMSGAWPLSQKTVLFEDSDALCVQLGDRAVVTGVTASASPEVTVTQAALQTAHWGKDSAFYMGAEDDAVTLDRPYHRMLPAAVDVRCDRRQHSLDPASWVGLAMLLQRTGTTAYGEAHLHGIDVAYDIDGDHKVLHVPLDVRWCPSAKGCEA